MFISQSQGHHDKGIIHINLAAGYSRLCLGSDSTDAIKLAAFAKTNGGLSCRIEDLPIFQTPVLRPQRTIAWLFNLGLIDKEVACRFLDPMSLESVNPMPHLAPSAVRLSRTMLCGKYPPLQKKSIISRGGEIAGDSTVSCTQAIQMNCRAFSKGKNAREADKIETLLQQRRHGSDHSSGLFNNSPSASRLRVAVGLPSRMGLPSLRHDVSESVLRLTNRQVQDSLKMECGPGIHGFVSSVELNGLDYNPDLHVGGTGAKEKFLTLQGGQSSLSPSRSLHAAADFRPSLVPLGSTPTDALNSDSPLPPLSIHLDVSPMKPVPKYMSMSPSLLSPILKTTYALTENNHQSPQGADSPLAAGSVAIPPWSPISIAVPALTMVPAHRPAPKKNSHLRQDSAGNIVLTSRAPRETPAPRVK